MVMTCWELCVFELFIFSTFKLLVFVTLFVCMFDMFVCKFVCLFETFVTLVVLEIRLSVMFTVD